MKYTVLLTDGTIGTLETNSEPSNGENVEINLHDENGNPITKTGTLSEILEESEY